MLFAPCTLQDPEFSTRYAVSLDAQFCNLDNAFTVGARRDVGIELDLLLHAGSPTVCAMS